MKVTSEQKVVCLDNAGYKQKLVKGKTYTRIMDRTADWLEGTCVVDETGVSNIFPKELFMGPMPRKGSLAICGIGTLGLITKDGPRKITYPDGNSGMAYVGIHLTDKVAPVGSPWSSRTPVVISHVDDFDAHLEFLDRCEKRRKMLKE